VIREAVRQRLKEDEGVRLKPYLDTVGKTTIGVGRNLDDVGISLAEADILLDSDIARAEKDAQSFDFYAGLSDSHQGVFICLLFNMGKTRLLGFTKFLAAAKAGNHIEAANELRDSAWFNQVGKRAERLCRIWLTDRWE
jgi:lysozyme